MILADLTPKKKKKKKKRYKDLCKSSKCFLEKKTSFFPWDFHPIKPTNGSVVFFWGGELRSIQNPCFFSQQASTAIDIVAEVLSKDTRSEMDMAFLPQKKTQKSVLPKKEMVDRYSYSWFDI